MLRKFATILTLALTMMFLLISCGGDTQSENQTDAVAQTPPQETPDANVDGEFVFTAYDVDGNLRSTAEWVGKQPVVLNFWGTWCPPCRKEIPDLVKVYDEFQDHGIEMIGLAVNDIPDNVIKFSMQNKMNWVMLMADPAMAQRYKITGVPTTIFIGRDGKELGRFVGPRDYETFKVAFTLTLQS